mmetsp:Transcript_109253/g.308193  ORF Transcript_109253/g.308193 Transcript_109253/m.308193 type:complete len:204 (+) Transcript_109253:901-1512(+)
MRSSIALAQHKMGLQTLPSAIESERASRSDTDLFCEDVSDCQQLRCELERRLSMFARNARFVPWRVFIQERIHLELSSPELSYQLRRERIEPRFSVSHSLQPQEDIGGVPERPRRDEGFSRRAPHNAAETISQGVLKTMPLKGFQRKPRREVVEVLGEFAKRHGALLVAPFGCVCRSGFQLRGLQDPGKPAHATERPFVRAIL